MPARNEESIKLREVALSQVHQAHRRTERTRELRLEFRLRPVELCRICQRTEWTFLLRNTGSKDAYRLSRNRTRLCYRSTGPLAADGRSGWHR
jgi:hypothetical protein